jgi:hypothetical protein
VASGTDTPTETKGGGQQWIVTEGPIGIEEALGLKRKWFRICNGIMKHTPEEDDAQNERPTWKRFDMHTMHLQLLLHLH